MKNFLIKLLGILILQSPLSVLYADETGYEVELIIFEDVRARYLNSEDWNYNDMLNNKKDESITKTSVDPQYKQLDWEGAKLASNLERLKKNSNFHVLESRRWKQTGLDREHAFNITIGEPVVDESSHDNEVDNEVDKELRSQLEPAAETPAHLTGSVKLTMSRYLHFNVDLKYIRPQLNDDGEMQARVFPVVNERRMRSREIHYIDHPLVGIVVLATPYKIKSADESTGVTEYKTM